MCETRVFGSSFVLLLVCVAVCSTEKLPVASIRKSRSSAQVTQQNATSIPTIPPPVIEPCSVRTSCDRCLSNASCLWCESNGSCSDYPVSYLIPPASICKLSQARWGVCWVNFEALIIAMAVVCGTLLLTITVCCCYCCCCRRRSTSRWDRDEEEFARRREEIRQRADERRVERKSKHDEIRKKYGLVPDSEHPYSKFENE